MTGAVARKPKTEDLRSHHLRPDQMQWQPTRFAGCSAKPLGRPMVDTFITEVSQDTWIYFPWDTGLAFQPPIREGGD